MAALDTLPQSEKDITRIVAKLRQTIERVNRLLGEDARIVGDKLMLTDGITAPSATSGYATIYVDTSDGDLKVKFGDGTTKTIATDT